MNSDYTTCPHCKAELTFEEIKQQECWSCGWPNPVDDDDSIAAFDTNRVDEMPEREQENPRLGGGLGHFLTDSNRAFIQAQLAAVAEYRQLVTDINLN